MNRVDTVFLQIIFVALCIVVLGLIDTLFRKVKK